MAIYTGDTGVTTSYEWDGPEHGQPGQQQVLDVEGYNWSYGGDWLCHDGFTMGVVCNLQVNLPFLYWSDEAGVPHVGVEAHKVDGPLAGWTGDSGGLVFALVGNPGGWIDREARGSVSALKSFDEASYLRFTEAPRILDSFGMRLAPNS